MPPPSEAQLLAQLQASRQSAPSQAATPTPSESQLLAILHNSHPGMNTGEDVARSGVTGLERGVTGLMGTPRFLSGLGDWATQQGANLAETMTGQHLTQQQRQQVLQAGHVVQSGSPFGLINPQAPSQAQLDRGVQHVDAALGGGGYHTPQTLPGRFTETAAEMAPNALLPGGPIARTARVLLPAATAQGAYELAPPGYKPAAKFGGALFGGGLEGGAEGIFAAPAVRMRNAMGDLDQATLDQVSQLRSNAASRGYDMTIPEAVQQVTGGATDLGNLQRLLESTPRTRGAMADYFSNRPQQVSGVVNNFVEPLLHGSPPPGVLAGQAQTAATGAMNGVRQGINATADPYYTALRGQLMPDADYATLAADPAYAYGLSSLESDPVLGKLLSGPPNDLSNVNEVVKHLDTLGENARPNPVNPYGDATKVGLYDKARGLADALAGTASPDWRLARDTVANGRAAQLEPMQLGPVGSIASGSPDLGSQTAALYPAAPFRGQPQATGDALLALGSQNPDLPAQLTGQHIANTFDQSARSLQGGANQFAGARFVSRLMGNPTQADTLAAGLATIDPSGAMNSEAATLADILASGGQRMPVGSRTAFNESEMNPISQAPGIIRMIHAGDPLEIPKNLGNFLGARLAGRNFDQLAGMVTDPDTESVLARVLAARAQGPGPYLLPAATQNQGATGAQGPAPYLLPAAYGLPPGPTQ